jgi:RNA polymerase sigma factor (sigma-70 family)
MDRPPPLNADAWVDRYGDALFHFARARVKDSSIAEDLVQDTFLAAVQSKERYEGKSSEKTWLFSILKHKIIDHYRKKKNIVNVQDFIEDPDRVEAFFNARDCWVILYRARMLLRKCLELVGFNQYAEGSEP